MMLENIDTSCCLAFSGDKQWLRKVAQVMQVSDLSITLKKILGTWRVSTGNESSASKKSSLSAVNQSICVQWFFRGDRECAVLMFTNITIA